MIQMLIHRLECVAGPDIALDCDILNWLESLPGFGRTERWLRHHYGITHCQTGAKRLLDDLFPGARYQVGSGLSGSSIEIARVAPHGCAVPHIGMSRLGSAALVAATLRAYEAARGEAEMDGARASRVLA